MAILYSLVLSFTDPRLHSKSCSNRVRVRVGRVKVTVCRKTEHRVVHYSEVTKSTVRYLLKNNFVDIIQTSAKQTLAPITHYL